MRSPVLGRVLLSRLIDQAGGSEVRAVSHLAQIATTMAADAMTGFSREEQVARYAAAIEETELWMQGHSEEFTIADWMVVASALLSACATMYEELEGMVNGGGTRQ